MPRVQRVLWLFAVVLASASRVSAQDVDARRYAVTYVEVLPAATARASEAFRSYRDQSRREDGFVALELGEQIGRPGHFAIVETWRDQAAFDAHQKAASFTQLTSSLQEIRTSGYDQRPYKTLAVAAPRGAAARSAVTIVSHVDIGGGAQIDVPALLRKQAAASRAEAGSIRFDVLQHTARANHFTVVEIWADQQALDRHAAAAHTRQYRDAVQPVSGSPVDERVYKAIE
jgi:quinol monooxygenase YgiN